MKTQPFQEAREKEVRYLADFGSPLIKKIDAQLRRMSKPRMVYMRELH
jgi:hypothetical protein